MSKSIDEVPKEVSDKLVKMLGLAYKGGTQAEVESAMSMAVRYATRHQIEHFVKDGKLTVKGLDEADVGVAPPTKEAFDTKEHQTGKGFYRRPPCNKYLCWILQSHFNVSVIYHGSKVMFVGRKSDTAFAVYAYKFMHREFTRIWRKYRRENDAPMSDRNACFYGIYDGLNRRLSLEAEESKKEELEKLAAEYREEVGALDSSYAIAVVAEKEERARYEAAEHPILTPVKVKVGDINNYDAVRHGREAGAKLHINMPLEGAERTQLK